MMISGDAKVTPRKSEKSPMRSLAIVVLLFFPMLFSSITAVAQNRVGIITGVLSDDDRAVVPNVPVQAKNVVTDEIYKVVSSSSGTYTFSGLPAGTYELSVSVPGFQRYEKRNIILEAGQTFRADIPLRDEGLNTLGENRAVFGKVLGGSPPPDGPAPSTPDGKPDLSGIWFGLLPVEEESEPAELLPWAQALAKERTDNNIKDHPSSRCLPGSITLFSLFNQIIQTPSILVLIHEGDVPGHRLVYLDGREHPRDKDPTWTGHSIGKWDGDTLVIDTTGFNDRSWLSFEGAEPHTEMLHMTTRLRRLDLGHLEVNVTLEDPGALKKPWKMKGISTLAPKGEEIGEYICNENNQDVEHQVGSER
jgi:hypothetical protein